MRSLRAASFPVPRSATAWAALVAAPVAALLLTAALVGIARTRESQDRLGSLQAQSESASLLERARADFLNATGALAAVVITRDSSRYLEFQLYLLETAEDLSSAHRIIVDQGRTADALETAAILTDIQAFRDSSSQSATAYLQRDADVLEESQAELTRLAEGIIVGMTAAAEREQAGVAEEKAALESTLNRTLIITIALGATGLGIGGAAMAILVLAVIRPITGLGVSARAIAAGELDRRARLAGPSEVRSLAADFNLMTETLVARNRDLESTRAQLETLNQSLESRVHERTVSLERLAEELKAEIQDRIAAQETIRHLAYRDSLTGLPNRVMFVDGLRQALAGIRRSGRMAAVIFIDLDRFKDVNDSAGHAEGDRLLKKVARRLKSLLREGDTLARFGGDEFVLVLPDISDPGEAVAAARRILAAVRKPWKVNSREFYVAASMGISLAPLDGDDPETLLRNADTAMYRAKEHGRNSFELYAPEMNARIAERLAMENDLRQAISRSELTVHYQPQVEIATGQIVGVEALMRWQHPERGLMLPSEFIPVAEAAGLIVPLDDWVLHTACADARAWIDAGLPPIRVAVNLSAHQFVRRNLVEKIVGVLKQSGIDPPLLQVEITEGVAMADVEFTIRTLHELRDMGIGVAIDDFGTGQSSLSYVKHLPIDAVKIDRSFIKDLPDDPVDAALVSAIISICHSMRLTVIAEGVETAEQLAFLRNGANARAAVHDEHCDEFQGFLFSHPVPAPALQALLGRSGSPSESPAVGV